MAYTNWQIIKISELVDYAYPEELPPNYRLYVAVDEGDGIKRFDSSLIRVKFTAGGIMIDDKFNEIDAKIGAIGSFEIASIDAETGEPDVDEPSSKVIYLTRDDDSGETDPYTEWIYIEGTGWSIIGETRIDLSNYMQKVAEATAGNFASLTATGEVSDSGLNSTNFATAAQGSKADTAVQPGDLATVATSGSYDDLSDKPSTVMWLTYGSTYTKTQVDGWITDGYLLCVSYNSRMYKLGRATSYQDTNYYTFSDEMDYVRLTINNITSAWTDGTNYPENVKYLEGTVSSARDTMTVSKDSSNQTVVSSGDGTTAAPVYVRPKGHTAADNQFVVHEDGSISLNNFHSRFGYIEHHMGVANEKVIRFGFSRTASNVAHRDSCIRLQYARNATAFEVRLSINISESGTLDGIGATVTVGNSVSTVNVPKVYSYSNENWHWVFVEFSRGDANIDHYLNWEYSGENSDGLKVTLVEAVNLGASGVRVFFIPNTGNVDVDSGSFTGIGSASIPVYVDTSGRIVAGTKPVQVVNSIDSSSMVSDVLYVM